MTMKWIGGFCLVLLAAAGAAYWFYASAPADIPAPSIDSPATAADIAPAQTPPPVSNNTAPVAAAPDTASAPPKSLDAAALEESIWEADVESGTVTLQFLKDGVLKASHPMLKDLIGQDGMEGTWRVEGNKLITVVNVSGDDQGTEFTIVGDQIFREEKELKRIK